MKKSLIFLIFIFLFILIYIPFFPAEITGESITGEASAQSLALNITVTATQPPPLTIISPENETYLNNESIFLSYSVNNEDFVWYNLDLVGDNTTITDSIYFNTSQGGHTLYLYANNTYGTTTKNITFTVNSTRFIILYSEYRGSTKGNSKRFNNYSYENIQNLEDIILENTDWGKIRFNQAINLTEDLVSTDNELDLDSNTNVSENRIELNSTALPNFNTPATLWLYNLTFDSPRILKDESVCTSPNCVIESYTGETLKFNVTGFSVYSAEETPVTEEPPSGSGRRIVKDFSIDKERIKISLKQGETKKEQITIKNKGDRKTNFKVSAVELEEFIRINEAEFDLDAGKSKTINIDFIAREEIIPDLYIGKIIIEADGIKKEILVIIEIESKGALFDVAIEIPRKFRYVLPGEEIIVGVELTNLGEIGKRDVEIEYIIKNKEGELIISEKETIAVETKASIIKTLQIPKDAKRGEYIIYIKVIYNGKTASASAWFTVGKTPLLKSEIFLYISIIVLVIIVLVIVYEIRKIKKEIMRHKIDEYTLEKEGLIK